MTTKRFLRHLKGPFRFIRPNTGEIEALFPHASQRLPEPQLVYLADETAAPLRGFPVLRSPGAEELVDALHRYIDAEELAQISAVQRVPFDRTSYRVAWDRYSLLLCQALENATLSTYGRDFPAIFWLDHSLNLARRLHETPTKIRRLDLEIGRSRGDQIKYRVFEKYVDRVRSEVFDLMQSLAEKSEEEEEKLFPWILNRMFDNVLIFTEDLISSDLAELSSYMNGYLRIDPKDFRSRLARVVKWNDKRLEEDPDLGQAVRHLVRPNPGTAPRELIKRSGYATYLAHYKGYNQADLLQTDLVQVWEDLLLKLKEYEVFDALRSLIIPLRSEGGRFVFRAGSLDKTWNGKRELRLSSSTRPCDFLSPTVIEPRVRRFGMVYDISQFSATVSMLRSAGTELQERAFRSIFRFQQKAAKLADSYQLRLEKYLGDGAFFTTRHPAQMLACALHLQRLYREAVNDGLSFDRGLRIGLNLGSYRLIPIPALIEGDPHTYEFFGHGVVELSRITSGKGTQEIEETKTMLIGQGYPRETVTRFFEPLERRNLDVVDKSEEQRRFFAYINRNGTLINEGIVATGDFVAELGRMLGPSRFAVGRMGRKPYCLIHLEDPSSALSIGLRRLGQAKLKGLDRVPVFEAVDGQDLDDSSAGHLQAETLSAALDRLSTKTFTPTKT